MKAVALLLALLIALPMGCATNTNTTTFYKEDGKTVDHVVETSYTDSAMYHAEQGKTRRHAMSEWSPLVEFEIPPGAKLENTGTAPIKIKVNTPFPMDLWRVKQYMEPWLEAFKCGKEFLLGGWLFYLFAEGKNFQRGEQKTEIKNDVKATDGGAVVVDNASGGGTKTMTGSGTQTITNTDDHSDRRVGGETQ